jgi:hypothetical protein
MTDYITLTAFTVADDNFFHPKILCYLLVPSGTAEHLLLVPVM